MIRRLLAIVALFTGLAAVASPVQAGFAGAAGGGLECSTSADMADMATVAACPKKCTELAWRVSEAPSRKAWRQGVRVAIPTVHFGADRAFE